MFESVKKIKIFIPVFMLLVISFLGFKIYNNFNISKDLKIQEKIRLKKAAKILNKCFDLKNKSQRTLNESMKLIEYCLKKYGPIN